jgi:hypothetical protein
MRINKMPIKISVEVAACPFFIKRIRSVITAIVKNISIRLPVVSLLLSLYFKWRLPTIKGKRTIPHTILRSKCNPNKNASKELENEYWIGPKW